MRNSHASLVVAGLADRARCLARGLLDSLGEQGRDLPEPAFQVHGIDDGLPTGASHGRHRPRVSGAFEMWRFAWQNLMTRPARTVLAIVGLSIPVFGVLGLLALSQGIRNLMESTLGQVHGVLVIRANVPGPIFSDLPADLADRLLQIPGIRVVAPEVWKIAPPIEGKSILASSAMNLMTRQRERSSFGIFDAKIIEGMNIAQHLKLQKTALIAAMLPPGRGGGRFLNPSDAGLNRIIVSTKTAADFPDAQGHPRKVGDSLKIANDSFQIVGMFDTGSLVLDRIIAMDISTARRLLGVKDQTVSAFLIEPVHPAEQQAVIASVNQMIPEVEARSTSDMAVNITHVMNELDAFLFMVISLAMLVGCIGIINTMLMSTLERYVEFGILRTNGWKRKNVLQLVLIESSYLGLLSGFLGCGLALVAVSVANLFLSGLQLRATPIHLALGIGLAVVMGVAGGLYPAWYASSLLPMEAIRKGTR
jgi:putative ABC transport system permease protein